MLFEGKVQNALKALASNSISRPENLILNLYVHILQL